MKRNLLILAAVTAALSTHAQSRRGLWVTPNVAIGAGTVVDKGFLTYDNRLSVYFSGGADVGYMFNNYLGVFAGLNLSRYGYVFDASDRQNPDLLYTGTQGMLEIPVYARFVVARPHHLGFFVHAGFKYGFYTGHKSYVKIDGHRSTLPDNNEINDLSVSPFAYLGLNIPAGRRMEMTLGPEVSYQYTYLFNYQSSLDGRYLNVGLRLGVGFKCTK